MSTTFTGVRMSNVRTKKNNSWLQRKKANRIGGQGLSDSESIQNALADVDNNCPYPSYPIMAGEQNGGGIPESFLKMKFKDLRDKVANRGAQEGAPMAPYFDSNTITVEDALVVMLAAEYQGFKDNDYLMLKVASALACNRYHFCKAQNNFIWLIGTQQMGTGNSKAKAELLNQYKDKVVPILRGGPGMLVGKIAKVKKGYNVEVWNKGTTQHKKAPNSHIITLEDMQSVYSYCTAAGYDYEHIGSTSKAGGQKSFENKNIPNNSKSLWKKGKFLFQEYNTVFVSNPDAPDKKYWQPVPKPLNDNKNKIEEFSMGFYNAVRLSSQNSSVNCDFGVSKEKSNGYTLYLTNGKKSNMFGKIFDIILNTEEYYNQEESFNNSDHIYNKIKDELILNFNKTENNYLKIATNNNYSNSQVKARIYV
jgi:hypothetical protein